MKKNEDMEPLVICKSCLHWKDASAATGYQYGFCTKPHSTTKWNFYCRDGEPDGSEEGGKEER